MALAATVLLFVLLGGMAMYQQFSLRQQAAPSAPSAVDQLPAGTATAPPDALTTDAAEAAAPQPGATPAPEPEPGAQRPERLARPIAAGSATLKAYGSLDDAYGDYRLYGAVAYAAALEQPVAAAAGGTVVAIEDDPVEGTTLVLDHGGGMLSRYAGLGEVLVDLDAEVAEGETIAKVGPPSPLRAEFGSHLSFSVWVDGEAVDPDLYLAE